MTYDYSQQGYGGSPQMMTPQVPYTGQIMTPEPIPTGGSYSDSFDDEPPLLEGKLIRSFFYIQIMLGKKRYFFEGLFILTVTLYSVEDTISLMVGFLSTG